MAQTFLQSLGQALRGIGASTSDANFQAYNRQNELSAERDQRSKELALGLMVKAVENGMMDPADFQQKVAALGYSNVPNPGLSPQVQKMRAEDAENKRLSGLRSEVPKQIADVESRLGIFPADAQQNISGQILPESEGVSKTAPSVDVPPVGVMGEPSKWDDPSERLAVANELEKMAVQYDADGLPKMAEAARGRAKTHRDEAKALEAAIVGDKESENEAKIRRYEEIGVPREEAIKLVQGAYKIATDAQGRDYVYDLVKKRRVTELDPIVPAIRDAGSAEGPNLDVESATGVSGAAKRGINRLVGLFGGGLVFEDAEAATEALDQLRITTIGIGEAQIPGRPSNFQLQLVDNLTINPRNILTGDAKALSKLKSTRSWLQREYDRMYDVVLGNPRQYSPREISETLNNASQMGSLINQYNWMIERMEMKGKPRKSMEEIDKETQ